MLINSSMCKGAKSQSDISNRAIPLAKHISTYTTKYELSQYLNLGEQMYKSKFTDIFCCLEFLTDQNNNVSEYLNNYEILV